jgi:hypothetical protein
MRAVKTRARSTVWATGWMVKMVVKMGSNLYGLLPK